MDVAAVLPSCGVLNLTLRLKSLPGCFWPNVARRRGAGSTGVPLPVQRVDAPTAGSGRESGAGSVAKASCCPSCFHQIPQRDLPSGT